ncbi:hypothetical protein P168DRAFT_117767 [Aspergillus campestris IBT 28561]|uniref:Uncharacterized protein n=1 Tax=Aspergillus campestris (strain IBT 28561) TaxID=1392248 RepID=A0A2I1DA31_ASPC2|nr:uncharacterized protein P168DRAFT_117767 [Aspergillus campestris IBT 28561]PKY06721.1 hypothetical protein P168DRAFT_117767 [Aspergillus campestris IBT 28561]
MTVAETMEPYKTREVPGSSNWARRGRMDCGWLVGGIGRRESDGCKWYNGEGTRTGFSWDHRFCLIFVTVFVVIVLALQDRPVYPPPPSTIPLRMQSIPNHAKRSIKFTMLPYHCHCFLTLPFSFPISSSRLFCCLSHSGPTTEKTGAAHF